MITAIVCTYNRCESLRETLRSLQAQVLTPGTAMRILVIDNNSSDQTRQVVDEAAAAGPNPVRYVFEPLQGLSHARNRALHEAADDYLAFLDDDVIVEPDWIEALLRCFRETGAQGIGGAIKRLWRTDPPAWFTEELGGALISQDLGPDRKPWDQPARHMVGANMAFRRDVFTQHGPFRTELGRRGDALIGGEDRELFCRLAAAQCSLWYEPSAIVWHKVEEARLTKPFFRRWFWDIGQTLGHQMAWQAHYRLTVAPMWVWGRLIAACLRFAKARCLPASEAERFASEVWVRFQWGVVTERLRHWLPCGTATRTCVFTRVSLT